MATLAKVTPETIIEAIRETRGNLTKAAKSLGVSTETIRLYRKKYPEIEQALVEAKQAYDGALVDLAVTKLEEHLKKGDKWAIELVLTTKGAADGWVKKQDNNVNINIRTWADVVNDEQKKLSSGEIKIEKDETEN